GRRAPSAPLIVAGKIAADLVDHFERAEQFAVSPAERHAQQRARLEGELTVDAAIDFLLLLFDLFVDAPRFACLHDLPNDATIVGNPQFATFDPQRRAAHE